MSNCFAQIARSSEVVFVSANVENQQIDFTHKIEINISIKDGWYIFAETYGNQEFNPLFIDLQVPEDYQLITTMNLEGYRHINTYNNFSFYSGELVFSQYVKTYSLQENQTINLTVTYQACDLFQVLEKTKENFSIDL